ncbi:MAG: hypothetical protein WC141_05065 [Arcobacteraceae bacterium]
MSKKKLKEKIKEPTKDPIKEGIKSDFAKIVFNAKIVAGLFLLLLIPSVIMLFKDIDTIYGLDKDAWFRIVIVGFIIYVGNGYFFWKCPSCKKSPGRGWFRKNCEKCKVELS